MEDASNALLMAGALLIMVVMLTVCISSLTSVQQTATQVLLMRDRETDASYINYAAGTKRREIGAETIIPSIYRHINENYRIEFYDGNLNAPITLWKIQEKNADGSINTGETKAINYIDLSSDTVKLGETTREDFLNCLLYGTKISGDTDGSKLKKIMQDSNIAEFDEITKDNGLYQNLIESHTFEEQLGVYYENASDNVPQANWTEKRVIAYIKIN